jgi:hypothetical protein
LSGLHFDLIFDISQNKPTAGATDRLFCLALKNNNCLAFILASFFKYVKAVPQQVLLTEVFASVLKSDNCLAFIFTSYLKSVKAVPQQVLLTVCFASALKNNNCLAFILTSYLKSVQEGPQRLLIDEKRLSRGKAEGQKGASAF